MLFRSGVCQSECRNKEELSDHVPIWADITYLKNGPITDLAAMEAGKSYNIMIQSIYENCGLQWQGGNAGSGERNAKFDCEANPDPLRFEAATAPQRDSQGNVYITGYLKTEVSGHTCGLEWDSSKSGGERNAKWDCDDRADPVILRSLNGSSGAQIVISSIASSEICGLEWDSSISGGERNAKWDCSPSHDSMRIFDVE